MAMTGMRSVTTKLGLVDETPPEAIVIEAAPRLLGRVPPGTRPVALELLHWTYGAAAGAAFGGLPARVRARSWSGPVYGLVTWLAFEAGIAPALGLARTKERRPLERAALAADHVLYGAIVAGSSAPTQRP